MEELNERRRRILHAVITEYVATAEPVGSRTLSKRYEIDLSPATIRNVMSDLEEMGYFVQPHTSSGRVPTDKAFRFYIEEIAQYHPLDPSTEETLRQRTTQVADGDVRTIVSESSKALSELTHYAGLGFVPGSRTLTFKHIQLIRLSRRQILVVLVTDTNLVQNRLVTIERDVSQSDLDRMSHYLNSLLAGLTLVECRSRLIEEINGARAQYDAVTQQALQVGEAVVGSHEEHVFIEGTTNILQEPEFGNLERVRALFKAFEEKKLLLSILDKAMQSPGVHIYMGNDTQNESLENCALVTGTYGAGGRLLGAIGVIGPMRMDYARVVPLVEATSRLISRQLDVALGVSSEGE